MEIREIAKGDGWVYSEYGSVHWIRVDVPASKLEATLAMLHARFGRRHPHWIVDLSKSDYVDSRVLGALLQLLDQHSNAGSAVALVEASDRATVAFRVLGFRERFRWFRSVEEAESVLLKENSGQEGSKGAAVP
ncbi:MAG: STAS domain-containing protein [Planctomycetota bacterium]|nr:STAS domain-containing protein [Planctomycetota bacterium]